ncbi:LOW QUALITY PROTEIN: light-regulated protein 1, chloroplastic [Amaranthus tricolor]|uniref:LOW QUALITY PROTEIN: light-regulated protein 1, chloroplastic n=1 Tax=Amaranthus tricolor TaxID=29722 RepID=UPI00258987DB|nr:LOW QUALITY PROTEIN: light-regulated protein 1, chloroplastic [Amaranthus tricolor]
MVIWQGFFVIEVLVITKLLSKLSKYYKLQPHLTYFLYQPTHKHRINIHHLNPKPFFPSKSSIFVGSPCKITTSIASTRTSPIKATSSVPFQSLAFNYNSPFSVFPAEACEIVEGDACAAVMYPDSRLNLMPQKMMSGNNKTVSEQVEREYFDYNTDPKSVLRGEACDDLGGEFCEAPYMKGVY